MPKTTEQLEADIAELQQAVRELYALEARFKAASFDRDPKPALQKILADEYKGEEPAA